MAVSEDDTHIQYMALDRHRHRDHNSRRTHATTPGPEEEGIGMVILISVLAMPFPLRPAVSAGRLSVTAKICMTAHQRWYECVHYVHRTPGGA